MVNILISLLRQVEELREPGWDATARFVLDRLVVPTQAAVPGTTGLMLYPSESWGSFADSAREAEERPEDVLAFATVPLYDEWLTIPDHPADGEFVAVWRVHENGTLRTAVVDLSRGRAAGLGVEETIERLPDLADEPEEYPCETRAITLACEERSCEHGECVPYSWFDPTYHRPLYGCICATR
jgi:hypothetical protein